MKKLDSLREWMVNQIEEGEINIFVGAGVSRNSLPLGSELTKQIVELFLPHKEDPTIFDPYISSGILRLEVTMQIARETFEDNRQIMLPLLAFVKAKPNLNNYLLAIAIRKGCAVFTTNWDILIEIAYLSFYHELPKVLVLEKDGSEMLGSSDARNLTGVLVKLHGSIARFVLQGNENPIIFDTTDTIIAALNQVGRGLDDSKRILLHTFLKLKSTFVWGYSCMDDFDVFPALKIRDRKPFYWVCFDGERELDYLQSAEDWTKQESVIRSQYKALDPRQMELDNIATVTRRGDSRLWGNITSWIKKLADDLNLEVPEQIPRGIIDAVEVTGMEASQLHKELFPLWQKNLFAARLLAHVGEWGDRMHTLYSNVTTSYELTLDRRVQIAIEHAEKTTPNDLSRAENILGQYELSSQDISPSTRAYGLAILSNIKRRRGDKNAKYPMNIALKLLQREDLLEDARHKVQHYYALLIHQEVAEQVRRLSRKHLSNEISKILLRISEGKDLFEKGSEYFDGEGMVENYAMSQNGLGLLLLEKARAMKVAGQKEEALKVLEKTKKIFEENIIERRQRYGFFRGVGQAYRNLALVFGEMEKYDEAAQALQRSAEFYSMVKPVPPETDLYETFFRQSEVALLRDRPREALEPIHKWILHKRVQGDWHHEARGLKILSDAYNKIGLRLDAGYAITLLVQIYDSLLMNEEGRQRLLNRRFGPENGIENLTFAVRLFSILGRESDKIKSEELLNQLKELIQSNKQHNKHKGMEDKK